jgi:hypothetical protein
VGALDLACWNIPSDDSCLGDLALDLRLNVTTEIARMGAFSRGGSITSDQSRIGHFAFHIDGPKVTTEIARVRTFNLAIRGGDITGGDNRDSIFALDMTAEIARVRALVGNNHFGNLTSDDGFSGRGSSSSTGLDSYWR